MLITVFVCLLASAMAQLPHGHELKAKVDQTFGLLDTDLDGEISMAEWNAYVRKNDLNNDNCLTKEEYQKDFEIYAAQTNTTQLAVPQGYIDGMFAHYDHNANACITEAEFDIEFHKADLHPQNGQLERTEYDKYFTHLVQHIVNGLHGHGRSSN